MAKMIPEWLQTLHLMDLFILQIDARPRSICESPPCLGPPVPLRSLDLRVEVDILIFSSLMFPHRNFRWWCFHIKLSTKFLYVQHAIATLNHQYTKIYRCTHKSWVLFQLVLTCLVSWISKKIYKTHVNTITLPETHGTCQVSPSKKETIVFQASVSRCYCWWFRNPASNW